MKKIFTQIMMLVALFMATTTVDAQGIKVIKKDGTTIEIPAAELDRIETYEATAQQGKFYEGVWKMKQLVTDRESMDATWGGMATYGDAFPSFNAADQLTFGNGKLTPALSSTFQNFFIGDATIEELPGTYALHAGMGGTIDLTILKVTGVNRNFDAASKSENNVAYIGVREIEDEDADVAGVMLLDVYLIDYEATSFAKELLDFGMYSPDSNGNPYMAWMTGMFINFTMEKAGDVKPVEKKFYEGDWAMNQLVTDRESMDATWGGMATYGDAFPSFNANDKISISGNTLTPTLSSTFQNFFIGDATIEELPGTYALHAGMGGTIDLTILKVTGVNRNFDAASKSENNVAYIGVREIEDEDADVAGVMLLDVYLIDYEATSFAKELLDFGMYSPDSNGNPYMAWMTGMFINFTMKKANKTR